MKSFWNARLGLAAALVMPFALASCGDDDGGTNPPTTGSIEVSSVTTGDDIDADGYVVTVDAGSSQAIDANGTVTFSNLSSGEHAVALSDIAANCTVSGDNPRNVTVSAGSTVSTTFQVACTGQTGDVDVTTATTGDDIDADGYELSVDAGAAQTIGVNATVTVSGLSAGNHSFALGDVAANCTVTGDNPRDVSVTGGGTATTQFDVTCTSETGDLKVVNVTAGNNPQATPFDLIVDGGAPSQLAVNDSTALLGLAAGDHSVELSSVAANCTVTGANPQTVTVTSGTEVRTQFDVSCVAGSLDVTTVTTGLGLDADGYGVALDGGTPFSIGVNDNQVIDNGDVGTVSVELTGVAANCTVNGDNPRDETVSDGLATAVTFEVFCFQALTNQIVFESDREGNREVYSMTSNGSQQTNLTNDPAEDGRPDVAPDGSAVVFESNRASANYDLWKMSAAGFENLTSSVAQEREPTYAGDFTKIAYARKTSSTTWQIWKINPNGTTAQQLTDDLGDDEQPAYSADGTLILFRSDRDGGAGEIYVMNADGTAETRLTTDIGDDGKPAWSPDGSQIVWASDRSGNFDIWKADFDAGTKTISNLVNLTNDAASDIMPDWSANGSTIAFSSDRDGNFEVYTMAADGSGQAGITAVPGGSDLEAAWSP